MSVTGVSIVMRDEPVTRWRLSAGRVGVIILLAIVVPCIVTLPWSMQRYDTQRLFESYTLASPSWSEPMGTDRLGRSLLWRCLIGGSISLMIGAVSAIIALFIGVTWGGVAGYLGGRTDDAMMRIVDVIYGLPSILLVVLIDMALKPHLQWLLANVVSVDGASGTADVVTLMIAIGSVSWLTMARVIRGQVLSLRAQPFVEAARACGVGPVGVMSRHLLPNLVGPMVVYAALAVPAAILSESFLSFLGIGVQAPLPSWGNLASEGVPELYALSQRDVSMRWWLLFWPCVLLGLTLMALNFLGDALRSRWDPRRIR